MIMHVQSLAMQRTMSSYPFHFSQILHRLNKTIQHRNSILLIQRPSLLLPFRDVLRQCSLIQYLCEYLYALIFFHILVDSDRIEVLALVLLVELNFIVKVLVKFLLIAIFAQVDKFELSQTELGEPGQRVFITKRSLFFSLSLEDPKLIIFLGIFFFLRIGPPIIVEQTCHVLIVSDSLADLICIP